MFRQFSSAGRLASGPMSFGKRGLSTSSSETSSACSNGVIGVRHYSMSGKRTPLAPFPAVRQQDKQQQQPTETIHPTLSSRSKVPKFTMPRSEFMTANLFAQHRQLVEVPEITYMDMGSQPRASFKTISELSMCKGLSSKEANVPSAKLKQIYAAPASVYMRVTPDALIPEAMRLGPLAEPLLGSDSFSDGIGSLQMFGHQDEMMAFVEEFFDTILVNAKEAPTPGMWSIRRERRAVGARWMGRDMVDPMDEINSVDYQMTSVRRKRKTKMNKHKHRKLRKRTRALRKRLGK
ncbi:hypothetical protein BX661DRAFT_199655 [Kickxella alabastrina]|uniref:uncharacterized protein n=1 Tax=Kickxella alabastrina TaxID=61397 RepID=UPI00221EEDB1|nr:uncharacterized protein BX661DRAFT_199655 [Kickxella alabastrina]KAI7824491.1 hypothetical protein BX661DRAFT_199655 [Kickxella alabastrina]